MGVVDFNKEHYDSSTGQKGSFTRPFAHISLLFSADVGWAQGLDRQASLSGIKAPKPLLTHSEPGAFRMTAAPGETEVDNSRKKRSEPQVNIFKLTEACAQDSPSLGRRRVTETKNPRLGKCLQGHLVNQCPSPNRR